MPTILGTLHTLIFLQNQQMVSARFTNITQNRIFSLTFFNDNCMYSVYHVY